MHCKWDELTRGSTLLTPCTITILHDLRRRAVGWEQCSRCREQGAAQHSQAVLSDRLTSHVHAHNRRRELNGVLR